MKVNDLIKALADEIDIVRPELTCYLDDLASREADDPAFATAVSDYGEQVQRMGEAADMVGFPGLFAVCNHVADNIHLLLEKAPHERTSFIDFLRRWPEIIVHYLHDLNDPSIAAGLVDLLRAAPIPLSEDDALRIMHKLGSFPAAMNALEGEEGRSQRPVVAVADDVALVVPEDADQTLMDGFFQEAPEHSESLIRLINKMVSGEGDTSDLTAAKRIVHTLKGSGAIIGLNGLANLGHHFEDILEYFEKKEGRVSSNIASALLDGAYCLAQMVAFVMGADDYPEQALTVLQNILDIANSIDHGVDLERIALRGGTTSAAVITAQKPAVSPTASSGAAASGSGLRVSMKRVEELFRVSAEVSVHSAAVESQTETLSAAVKRLLAQQLRVKQRLFELETIVDVRALSLMRGGERNSRHAAFDPLEMEQYNELHSTSHALMEEFNDAMLLGSQLEKNITQLESLESRHQVLASDLQHLVIGTRMSEVSSLETRLQRNIRTTAQMTDKQVRLYLTGGDTLVDTDVLNQLADPLLHLLRNAVDHGIESPEEREAAGKDPVGEIRLDFTARGQQIILRCSDDGRGLNHQQIFQRAVDKGLIEANEQLSEDEIARLIFAPGFSTRDKVSEVSGRGIGLDVVREWLNKMNGSMIIESEAGEGMTITLQFASSLTTVQSLVVAVAKQSFALPAVHIQQALAHEEGQFVIVDDNLQYHLNDRVYAAKRLSDLLGLDYDMALDKAFAVLINVHDEIWALAVDRLVDSRELLLQPPGLYIRHINGLVGTSILGDGSIAIHLDMPELLERYSSRHFEKSAGVVSAPTASKIAKVLVVDDSLSVRNTLQELIEDAGFRVRTARDGIEAVNALDDFAPDVVLTDLEMPNMNGIELTTHIRNRADMQSLPVIMITSRSQDKHKTLATEAGVDDYFTKPYNDGELLRAISAAAAKLQVLTV